jgi:hypothetical protein
LPITPAITPSLGHILPIRSARSKSGSIRRRGEARRGNGT